MNLDACALIGYELLAFQSKCENYGLEGVINFSTGGVLVSGARHGGLSFEYQMHRENMLSVGQLRAMNDALSIAIRKHVEKNP